MLHQIIEGSVTTLLSRFGSGSPSIRMPHLLDILAWFNRLFHSEANSETPIHTFMRGVESEADTFFMMRPRLFFINCVVTMGIDQVGCSKLSAHIVFPVILKHDQYYIIIGEERTPVYRVINPKELFFTTGGRNVLRYLLSRNYCGDGESFDFYENSEGNREAYCVPNFINHADCYPSNRWDDCKNSLIAKQLVFPLVDEPVVPAYCKSSVQIVNLNDPINIIDIHHPRVQWEIIEKIDNNRGPKTWGWKKKSNNCNQE